MRRAYSLAAAAAVAAFASWSGLATAGPSLPGAKVTVTGVTRTFEASGVSDETGARITPDLPPGAYRLEINKQEFGTVTQTGLLVAANSVTRSDAELKVAGVNQSITVNEATQALQTDRGTTIDEVHDGSQQVLYIRQFLQQELRMTVPLSSPDLDGFRIRRIQDVLDPIHGV